MRSAFYISDGTAITSEVFGHALLSLFPTEFEHHTISFVETVEKAEEAKEKIWDEVEEVLRRFETPVGFESTCELLICSATK